MISRREWLRIGGIGLGGLALPAMTAASQTASSDAGRAFGRAKSVIVIFLGGGPPQHETWDPKPDALEEIRGAYGTTATKLAGVRFCEYLPRLAARAGITSRRNILISGPPSRLAAPLRRRDVFSISSA